MLKLKPRSKDPKRPRVPSRPKDVHAPPSPLQRFLGWCVHAYTGLGLVCAAFVVLLFRGGYGAFRLSLLLMFVATIVDATDGTLARLVHIKKAVPSFDGRRLDDLIDFQTYTCLPLLLIWRAGLLPPGQEAWLLLPLATRAYGFCQIEAKTDSGDYLSFPYLW